MSAARNLGHSYSLSDRHTSLRLSPLVGHFRAARLASGHQNLSGQHSTSSSKNTGGQRSKVTGGQRSKTPLSTSGQQTAKRKRSNVISLQPRALTALSTSGQQPLSTSGQQAGGQQRQQALSTSGQRDPNKPPRPVLPAGVQADCEWRGSNNKSGESWTLLFRPYTVENRKKQRGKSEFVCYLTVKQWQRLKEYDRNKQCNAVQAEFDYWWEENAPSAARLAARA